MRKQGDKLQPEVQGHDKIDQGWVGPSITRLVYASMTHKVYIHIKSALY